MLRVGSCEKMVVISSTTNEWPQQKNNSTTNNQIDGSSRNMHNLIMSSSSSGIIMEKQTILNGQDQPPPPPQQPPLKCPRCDSSNTKFCYYNNYSLSQPRHFCKACKRYWTRGGTLRNVPVGGGCRKNKRIRRPSQPSISSSPPNPHNLQSAATQIDHPSSSPSPNPFLYGLPGPTNSLFPRLLNSRVSSSFEGSIISSGYDHGNNNMELGFSSHHHQGLFGQNGFLANNNTSNSILSSYPMFGSSSSSSSSTTSTTLASLIASSLHQGSNGNFTNSNGFHGLMTSSLPYGEMQGNIKEVKMEVDGQNRLLNNWSNNNGGVSSNYQIINNEMGQINGGGSDNPSTSLSWNYNNGGGSWFDPNSNMGSSSVSSLI